MILLHIFLHFLTKTVSGSVVSFSQHLSFPTEMQQLINRKWKPSALWAQVTPIMHHAPRSHQFH